MTYRRSEIINICWLHSAEPAQSKCANRSGKLLSKAIPKDTSGLPVSKLCDPQESTAVQDVKRSAEIAVASIVSALSP